MVTIGSVKSLGRSNGLELVPDDRQELVKIIGGVTVEDYGEVNDGEVISFSAVFSAADYETLKGYWSSRTLVPVILDDGRAIQNARVVIRRASYADDLLNSYKNVQLEIWRI